MSAGSAAKQMVDLLLARFLPLARRRIETAQAQVSLETLLFDALVGECELDAESSLIPQGSPLG